MSTTKQNIPCKQIPGNPELVVSKELLSQISYLHNKIGGIEWSGLVFYKIVSGEISDPDKLKLRAERLYLMDIGNATYTEFSPDETIIDFYDKYPQCEAMKWGMIHTHHGMDTFFSGTDLDELRDNSGPHQFYLSLIVNYKDGGKFSAKLGIMSEVEMEFKYTFREGINLFKKNPTKTEKQLLMIDCNIVYEQDTFDTDRYDAIKKAKSEIVAKKQEFEFREYPTSGKQLPINFLGHGKTKYVPKTKSEIDAYLSKLLSLNMHTTAKLADVLEEVDKHIKANPEMADAVYYDLIEEAIEDTYVYTFNDYLMVEHHNAFFKQCVMMMDNFRMRGYSFYDKIIDIFDMYIDIAENDDFEDNIIISKNNKKSIKKHSFNLNDSKMDKLIKQADKALENSKKKWKNS